MAKKSRKRDKDWKVYKQKMIKAREKAEAKTG